MRPFPFGSAALAILILSLLSGTWLLFHPASNKEADLVLWVFNKEHKETYTKALPGFYKKHPGVKVDIQLVSLNAMAARLQAAFLADVDVPDLCEIEITTAGTFFRGPLEHVGFLDITDRLHQTGLYDRMVKARFAPWSKQGHIFGLPHDVHPVMLAYNREVFEKEGVDVSKIQTWDDFIAVGRKLTRSAGQRQRYMIELQDTNMDAFEPLLFQRGGGYFSPDGACTMDDEATVETMLWFAPLVTGPGRIGNSLTGGLVLTQAMEDGYFLSVIAPDWRTKGMEKDIGHMSGKMALMPLPAVRPGGSRTSSRGGTMMSISKKCPNRELAWDLAVHLYLNKDDLVERFEDSNILPALPEAWSDPGFNKPREYWSGQPLGRLYADLAPQVPFQYPSPFLQVAKDKMSEALVSCVQQYNAQGDQGFEPFVRARLKQSANEVRRLVARNPY